MTGRPLAALLIAAWISPAKPQSPRPARNLPETDREAAVAAILRRAESAAPGQPEARRLSRQLEELGTGYLDRGDSGRAVELLAEAYALDEANGPALAQLTLAYARRDEFDSAAFYLNVAEERAGGGESSQAYASVGELFYDAHRLEEAVRAWGVALRQGGQDPALMRRLALSRDELAVSRGQRTESSEHFAIFAEPAISDSLLRRAATDLESAHRAQSAFFGEPLSRRQVVVLYGGRAFFALASVPDWVSGVYDGKIRVALRTGGEDSTALSAVLAHELAHALMRQVSGDRAPGWLHEGLAQWLEGRRIPRGELRAEVRKNGARSIEELDRRFASVMGHVEARTLYSQSLSLVEYLAALRGEGALACLVARLREGGSIADALREEASLEPAELFAGWSAWLEGGGPPGGLRAS